MLRPLRPPQDVARPHRQLPRRERLDDVVIRTELEADDTVDLVGPGGQQDHRDVARRPDRLQDRQTVGSGQHHVEHHQGRTVAAQPTQRLVAVCDLVDPTPSRSGTGRRPREPSARRRRRAPTRGARYLTRVQRRTDLSPRGRRRGEFRKCCQAFGAPFEPAPPWPWSTNPNRRRSRPAVGGRPDRLGGRRCRRSRRGELVAAVIGRRDFACNSRRQRVHRSFAASLKEIAVGTVRHKRQGGAGRRHRRRVARCAVPVLGLLHARRPGSRPGRLRRVRRARGGRWPPTRRANADGDRRRHRGGAVGVVAFVGLLRSPRRGRQASANGSTSRRASRRRRAVDRRSSPRAVSVGAAGGAILAPSSGQRLGRCRPARAALPRPGASRCPDPAVRVAGLRPMSPRTTTSTGSTPPSSTRRSRRRLAAASHRPRRAPSRITYDELLAHRRRRGARDLACVSNEVGGRLVGNAVWQGVPLPTCSTGPASSPARRRSWAGRSTASPPASRSRRPSTAARRWSPTP